MSEVAIDLDRLTPTERRIVVMLSDGFAHTHAELRSCLDDHLTGDTALTVHVCNLRKKLPPHLGILPDLTNGTAKYRLVRFVGQADG